MVVVVVVVVVVVDNPHTLAAQPASSRHVLPLSVTGLLLTLLLAAGLGTSAVTGIAPEVLAGALRTTFLAGVGVVALGMLITFGLRTSGRPPS